MPRIRFQTKFKQRIYSIKSFSRTAFKNIKILMLRRDFPLIQIIPLIERFSPTLDSEIIQRKILLELEKRKVRKLNYVRSRQREVI